eukprot:350232-Chlamydomonas_euryale.AAC.12
MPGAPQAAPGAGGPAPDTGPARNVEGVEVLVWLCMSGDVCWDRDAAQRWSSSAAVKNVRNRASYKAGTAVKLDRHRCLDAQIKEGQARLRAGNMCA